MSEYICYISEYKIPGEEIKKKLRKGQTPENLELLDVLAFQNKMQQTLVVRIITCNIQKAKAARLG